MIFLPFSKLSLNYDKNELWSRSLDLLQLMIKISSNQEYVGLQEEFLKCELLLDKNK